MEDQVQYKYLKISKSIFNDQISFFFFIKFIKIYKEIIVRSRKISNSSRASLQSKLNVIRIVRGGFKFSESNVTMGIVEEEK